MCAVTTTDVGTLHRRDPLYQVLAARIYPYTRNPVFHVRRLSTRHLVYRYAEQTTGSAVVGKFYRLTELDQGKVARIKGEYRNLVRLRSLGFATHPYSVVKPLCCDERIGLAVAEDFVKGRDLDYYMRRATWEGNREELKRSLSALAAFLCALHDRTVGARLARPDETSAYFRRIVSTLERQTVLDTDQVRACLTLGEKWLALPSMAAQEVTVHGDATPTNFIFRNNGVVAIDLERMKRSDRALDVGMVCGELKHAFLWRTGNPWTSEPFIKHFLKRYARHFPSPHEAFQEITRRVPFYMALTELRIARNGWLAWDYRKRLAWEARECLRWGFQSAR